VLANCSAQKLNTTLSLPDSVTIAYKHQVAAVKAFIELRYYKRLDSVNIRLLDFRQSQVEALDHSLNYYKSAYRQCDSVTVPSLKQSLKIKDEKIAVILEDQRKQKARAFGKGFGIGVGVGVAVETAVILILKFAIPKK